MANRTLAMMISNVANKVGVGPAVPPMEIASALNTANLELHGAYDWPWAYKETNISIAPSYTAGTISVNIGSTAVTGVGTAWPTINGAGWRLRLDANSDWPLVDNTAMGGTGLILAQAYYGPVNLSAAGYVLYRDSYPMPADFEPGKDLFLGQMDIRNRIRHIPRLALENQAIVLKNMFTNVAMGYAYQGIDTLGNHLIRIIPPPTNANTFRLIYKARPADLTGRYGLPSLAGNPDLPQTYQDILELMAEAEVKRVRGMQGWEIPAAIAARKKMEMKRQVVSAPTDNNSTSIGGSLPGDSSIMWRGMGIYPMP